MKTVLSSFVVLAGAISLSPLAVAADLEDINLSGFYDAPLTRTLHRVDLADTDLLSVDGEFGHLSFGAQDGLTEQMAFVAPSLSGARLTQDTVFEFIELNAINTASSVMVGLEDADEKILYVTPRVKGLQAGVSISADPRNENTFYALEDTRALDESLAVCGADFCDRIDPTTGRTVELGLAYRAETERGMSFDMSATYSTATDNIDSAYTVDPEAWAVGANLGYAGFTFGGSYKESDNLLGEGAAYESWDVGATYERGPWGFMLSYAEDECVACDIATTNLSGESSAVQGGVDYSIGKNISFGGGLQYKENEKITEDEESTVIYLETLIAF